MVADFDTTVPNIARVYDYWLGGKDNFAADRHLAQKMLEIYPPIARMVRENRQFLAQAAGWVAAHGVTQFIDLGAGLPTSPNIHEAALAAAPDARVAYVDNDPVVISHSRALLAKGNSAVTVLAADLSEPATLLSAPEITGFIDMSRPTCLILSQVLHFLPANAASDLVARYVAVLAPGSYVIITVGRGDGPEADRLVGGYDAAKIYNHSRAQFASFFTNLEFVPPGVTEARLWQPGSTDPPGPPESAGQTLVAIGRVTG
jgi:SAM-dependent methyltransferase